MAMAATLMIQTATVGGPAPSLEFQRFPRLISAGTKSSSRRTTIGHDSAIASDQNTRADFHWTGNAQVARVLRGSIAPAIAASQIVAYGYPDVPIRANRM